MDIGFYIADLLRKEEEVSIPGLGTFRKVRIPGTYNEVSNIFNPPSEQVEFKPGSSDYNSLKKYISEQKNLSETSSEYFIQKFTANLSELLENTGFVEIKPLGTIRKNNNTLEFERSGDLEIAGNFYGLRPITDRQSPTKTDDYIPYNPYNEVQGVLQASEEEEEMVEAEKKTNIKLLLAIVIPLILGGALLLYYFNPVVYNAVQKMRSDIFPVSKKSSAPSPVIPPVASIPDSTVNFADSTAIKEDSVTLNKETQPEVIPQPDSSLTSLSYEIIGVAFTKKNDAEEYIKKLAKKGVKAKIADNMPGKLIKISLGSFGDLNTAQTELIRIKKEVNKEAWIATINPKKQ